MSRSQQLLQLIADDIQHDLQDYPALQAQLQQLHGCLLQRDVQGIEALNDQISPRLQAIQGRALRRSKILRAFQLDPRADGMQRLLAAYPAAQRQELHAAWAQLARCTLECKQLNEQNGKLLAMQHDILSQLAGERSQLYSPPSHL